MSSPPRNNATWILRADVPKGAAPATRHVRIATIQPPAPNETATLQQAIRQRLTLLDEALESRPDVVCLPEHFNCLDHRPDVDPTVYGRGARDVLKAVAGRAARSHSAAIVPVVIDEAHRRYNRAYVIDRAGRTVGHFDKVHVTQVEQEKLGIEPGTDWPVFDLDFGRIGVMICYDGCFFESARILALAGAEIIFWPSLQRDYTKDQLELQTRSHAMFNYTVVVRSGYGGPICGGGSPNAVVGLSCVCAAGGEILGSIENREGWIAASVDLGRGPCGPRTFGGEVGQLRDMRLDDRRPRTYNRLVAGGDSSTQGEHAPAPHRRRTKPAKRSATPSDGDED